jgi:hypothetical protein
LASSKRNRMLPKPAFWDGLIAFSAPIGLGIGFVGDV